MKTILLVLDSVGIGSLPDAHLYDDQVSNTIKHIDEAVQGLNLPNLGNWDWENCVSTEYFR